MLADPFPLNNIFWTQINKIKKNNRSLIVCTYFSSMKNSPLRSMKRVLLLWQVLCQNSPLPTNDRVVMVLAYTPRPRLKISRRNSRRREGSSQQTTRATQSPKRRVAQRTARRRRDVAPRIAVRIRIPPLPRSKIDYRNDFTRSYPKTVFHSHSGKWLVTVIFEFKKWIQRLERWGK